jgi:hypothetical protein
LRLETRRKATSRGNDPQRDGVRGGSAPVKALPGNPYDGHTLAAVIPDIERTIGAELGRIIA